jgi:hypothetical protein
MVTVVTLVTLFFQDNELFYIEAFFAMSADQQALLFVVLGVLINISAEA